jgi:ubiquinone/menaquinone biosynthesis C-methylase UbiE
MMTVPTIMARNRRRVDHYSLRRRCAAAIARLAAIATVTLWSPYFALAWGTGDQAIADEMVEMLAIKPGATVAEIGAGDGAMAVRVAKKLGPGGRLFATEVDPALIEQIRERARKADLDNITVMTATPTDSELPSNCCDAAYMIGVYHHITNPAQTDASIFRALKPGARLLINDFPPTIWLALFKVKGVPANRGGHGVSDDIVINEITAAGFREMKETRPWHPGFLIRDTYCLVFSRPEDSKTELQKLDLPRELYRPHHDPRIQ